jgi:glycosyltransferase involved in cell wall biosynthesis
MKYPNVLFFRYDKFSYIDTFLDNNKDKLLCNINIINNKEELYKLFNPSYQILVTFGTNDTEYYYDVNYIIADRMRKRWIHKNNIDNIDEFNSNVNYCFISNISDNFTHNRPIFSLFTTCYNSYEKIHRAYNSIKLQTLKDWEWVILDDSPNDEHFIFLKNVFKNEYRVRLYKRSENSGNIGNVKNEAVLLCRGKYVIEMDHDDEILPDLLKDATTVFNNDNSIGFIYMDFINIYENGNNFRYSDFFSLGYSGYYRQKYNNKWAYVASTPNINNITLSHIVAVPNHPRIWRKSSLIDIGNYCEYLPVSDDYELLLRTAVNTKIAKIHKLGYIQYMNDNNNNFSLIRNSEINRLVTPIKNFTYEKCKITEYMKLNDSYEDDNYMYWYNNSQIWKRKDYIHKYCNLIINLNYDKQYCIIGLENLYKNLDEIRNLYNNDKNDFILLDNKYSSDSDELCIILDNLQLSRMKSYSMNDVSYEELVNYFMLIYKSCDNYYIYNINSNNLSNNLINNNLINNKMKITIITPSIRVENILKIKESIKFEYIDEWIIVYDSNKIEKNPELFINDENKDKISEYLYKGEGISGNPQRNFALENIKNKNTYLYYLDDDNIIHPNLYNLLDNIEPYKMYTFDQSRPPTVFPYTGVLNGDNIKINNIDTAMILIDYNLCKDIKWIPDKYNADGYYITECFNNNNEKWKYINEILSYYNYLS